MKIKIYLTVLSEEEDNLPQFWSGCPKQMRQCPSPPPPPRGCWAQNVNCNVSHPSAPVFNQQFSIIVLPDSPSVFYNIPSSLHCPTPLCPPVLSTVCLDWCLSINPLYRRCVRFVLRIGFAFRVFLCFILLCNFFVFCWGGFRDWI